MVTYKWGEIESVSEGQIFARRTYLREAWIHRAPVAGIDGNSKVGCSSIVLNGGYVDDFDLGDEIVYTGHGGNDPNTKKQIADQDWDDPGNKAAVPALIHLLQNQDVNVRRDAAGALGQIGTPEAIKAAVPVLIQLLRHQNEHVRRDAAGALEQIGTPEALKAVEEYQSRQ